METTEESYKIIAIGSKKARHMTCGSECMDERAADLIARMKGATIITEDEECPGLPENPALVEAGEMGCRYFYEDAKVVASYITIAISPAMDEFDTPLLSVKIPKRRFAELRELMDTHITK